jgi:hypothetical protein
MRLIASRDVKNVTLLEVCNRYEEHVTWNQPSSARLLRVLLDISLEKSWPQSNVPSLRIRRQSRDSPETNALSR